MIQILFDLATGTARLAAPAVIKLGADVPVSVTFSAAPGDMDTLQLALGTDAASPVVLAFTELFTAESATLWTALLDASDTRLVAHMANKGPVTLAAELVAVLDGVRQVAPNLSVTVQPRLISGPESTEGGPEYLTAAQIAAIYATLEGLAGRAAAGWTVVTAARTALPADRLAADTSDTAYTVTLPASPDEGDQVEIIDARGTWATHNLTVGRAGHAIAGTAEDLVLDVDNAAVQLAFVGGDTGWQILRRA